MNVEFKPAFSLPSFTFIKRPFSSSSLSAIRVVSSAYLYAGSLQHWTLLSAPDTSKTECHFHFVPAAAFCLEQLVIALCSSAVAYWTPYNLGGSSSGVISFCLFILFMGFSWQEYWGGLPFPPPVDHVLSELSTMTHPSWCPTQHGS